MNEGDFVLVSCSKSKRKETRLARELYEPSAIFRKRRRFAELRNRPWGVISAKYGYLRPWEATAPYEQHIDSRTPVWAVHVLERLLPDLEYHDADTVTILAGKKYVAPLVAPLETRGYDVVDFNRGNRPGERMSALDAANEAFATPDGEPLIAPRKPRELARECPVDIYLSGADGGGHGSTYFPWAYRMNRAKESGVSDTYVSDCDVFILDSAIDDPTITNEDVIEDTETYNPDYVIAADRLHNPEATTDAILEFLDLLEGADTDAEPILPLQPTFAGGSDHHLHYEKISHLGEYFAIGG